MKWTKIKVVGATALAVAFGIGTADYYLNRHAQAAAPGLPRVDNLATPEPLAALQETADRLRAENAQLTAALVAANARKAQLVSASQAAERVSRVSKDFAARNLAPTNGSPTMRDAFVSVGKLMRLSSLNPTNLAPQERKAMRDAANQETARLLQAAGQLDLFHMDDYSPASPEEAADLATGLLHGILELTPQQFTEVRAALAKYETQVMQENPQHKLELPDPDKLGAALDQIQNLLSQQQREVLQRVLQKTTSPGTAAQTEIKRDEQPPAQ